MLRYFFSEFVIIANAKTTKLVVRRVGGADDAPEGERVGHLEGGHEGDKDTEVEQPLVLVIKRLVGPESTSTV